MAGRLPNHPRYCTLSLEAIEQFPELGVVEIRDKFPDVYWPLYKFDAEWLGNNKPSNRGTHQRFPKRVDWDARDKWIIEHAPQASERLRKISGKPQQVTANLLAESLELPGGTLHRDLDKLPKTAMLLPELIESQDAFVLRRIAWVTDQYRVEGICPGRSNFIKAAGLGYRSLAAKVQEAVDDALQLLRRELPALP